MFQTHFLYEDSKAAIQSSLGKTIASVALADNRLAFTFTDGCRLGVWDEARFCCERRFMTTDDDLPYYVGATLLNIAIRDGGEIALGAMESNARIWGAEVRAFLFLVVTTDRGTFSANTYNEHNGYYGGFDIHAGVLSHASMRPAALTSPILDNSF
jgi:hypothetical protein